MKNVEAILDFRIFAPLFLKIKNEYGEILPLEFNSAQKKVVDKFMERYDSGKPLRYIILKARQQGISTLVQAFVFWHLYITKNQKSLTMGHKLDASNNLFDMYKRYHDQMDKSMRYKILRSNEKKISYAKWGSENKIETAGSGEIGRSDTLQALHLTEVAFYPDAKTTFLGLLQGAKYAKMHFIESTANGYNEFFNKWEDAVSGKSAYEPIFLSWLDFPEYVSEALKNGFISDLDDIEKEKFLNDLGNARYNSYPNEEHLLLEKYNASINELQWRRYAIDNLCEGDIDLFHQEYPRDPEEAFVSSGRPVFPMYIVQKNLSSAQEPLMRGDLVVRYKQSEEYEKAKAKSTLYEDLREYIDDVEFVENSKGFISIWTELDKMDANYRFCGGGDVAEGLEQGDFSVLKVLDRSNDKVHLTWHGHIDPDLFAEEIHKIYLFLKKDLHVAIERNNHGLTVINKLYRLGVPQYYKQSFNKGYEQSSSTLGWQTSSKTKNHMINSLNEWIREGLFQDYEKDFWKECRTFVKNSRGQMQADGKDKDPSTKNFDDRVIASALMVICNDWLPNIIMNREEELVARPFVKNLSRGKGKAKF